MGSVNKVILIGNLGNDAELRYTPSGQPVAQFNIATTEKWNGRDGEKHERTEWTRVKYWGKPAEAVAQYLVKGKQVYVEGRLETNTWTDKQGTKRYSTDVVCNRLVLIGSNGHGGARPARHVPDEEVGSNYDPPPPPQTEDDIPF